MEDLKSACCSSKVIPYMDNKYICSNCNHKCIAYSKKSLRVTLFFVILLIISILILSSYGYLNNKGNDYKLKSDLNSINDIELSDSAITNKLIELGCILPNVVLAQIKQETGHYKSKLTYTHKNIGGIRIWPSGKYKKYNTYESCLLDCIRIQDMYLAQIHKKYAQDTNYVFKLKYIK